MNLLTAIDWIELSTQWMMASGHFLWQGFAIALLFVVIESLLMHRGSGVKLTKRQRTTSQVDHTPLTRSNASLRYWLACLAFASLPICFISTFAFVHNTRGSFIRTSAGAIDREMNWSKSPNASLATVASPLSLEHTTNAATTTEAVPVVAQPRVNPTANPESAKAVVQMRLAAPVVFALYSIGAGVLLLRFGLSIAGASRFRILAQPLADVKLLEIVRTQSTRLKLKAVPYIAVCLRVSSPVVVGVVKPMILLPPAILIGLDPTQLAAILSHEMAHIRRNDPLINSLQRLIESLFFFHPVTWWLSRRISIERENCCDDIAASFVGRLTYAEALMQMATVCLANHQARRQQLATLAADGGNSTNFGYRIRRLLDAQESPTLRLGKRSLVFGLVALACLSASLVAIAQGTHEMTGEPSLEKPNQVELVDGIQWSTFGSEEGLLSGARLILPEGGVKAGDPVVVEYRLKNVSNETKKIACYVRGQRTRLSLDGKNRISDMGLDTPDEPIEITIEPNKEYIATTYTSSIDTKGLPPGEYQVALGSTFFYRDTVNTDMKHEYPHRGSIPFTIRGEPSPANAPKLDESINWGKPVLGLRLGTKLHKSPNTFSFGDIVEADLWIANVTDHVVECSIRLPHPMDGWLFNIETPLGDTILLERPPIISIFSPQRFFRLKLAPGETKLLTGNPVDGPTEKFAGRRIQFEVESKSAESNWADPMLQGRLVTEGGEYSAISTVMLDRPEVPGMHIELDSGNCSFIVGKPQVGFTAPRILDKETDSSILWGEPINGLRLGLRLSESARRRSQLSHGEHIDYEVWLKNETDEELRIARDPRDLKSPCLADERSINVVGSGTELSFYIPPEELAKAELILPSGHAARRFLNLSHSTSLREPGSARGRFGLDPLFIEPGKYNVFAQVGELKSGTEEIEIIAAARLQIRKSSRVTEKKREYAAQDPSETILSWLTEKGEKAEEMFNWDAGVLLDERDLTSAKIVPIEGKPDQYSIALQLQAESGKWFGRRIDSYSLWDDPRRVAIVLNGKLLGAVDVPAHFDSGMLIIPTSLPLKQAEAMVKDIQTAMGAMPPQPKEPDEPSTAATNTKGVLVVGQVKLLSEEWLFRRQVKTLPDLVPNERKRDFKGDSIDPVDFRLVHNLSWQDVESISVTVKANDGRDYSKTVTADKEGNFRFSDELPIGSYQIDARAVLKLDDDSYGVGVPDADMSAGTQLLRVNQDDMGEKPFVFELYPVGLNRRLRHVDPAQRSEIIGTISKDDQPVPGARVILYKGLATRIKMAEVTTDKRGQYRFENVRSGTIGVRVEHESLVPADGENWRDINGPQLGSPYRLDWNLTPGGFITGQLLDENKQPRAEVPLRFMLTGPNVPKGLSNFVVYATTDTNGNYQSGPLLPGEYVIEENADNYPVLAKAKVEANETTKL